MLGTKKHLAELTSYATLRGNALVFWGNLALKSFNQEPVSESDVTEETVIQLLLILASFDLKHRVYEDSLDGIPSIFVNACVGDTKKAKRMRLVAYRLYKKHTGSSARKALRNMKKAHKTDVALEDGSVGE